MKHFYITKRKINKEIKYELYYGNTYVACVEYIDYRDNGQHGYAISQVKNHSLFQNFQKEANILFPNTENPYIDYLDTMY